MVALVLSEDNTVLFHSLELECSEHFEQNFVFAFFDHEKGNIRCLLEVRLVKVISVPV